MRFTVIGAMIMAIAIAGVAFVAQPAQNVEAQSQGNVHPCERTGNAASAKHWHAPAGACNPAPTAAVDTATDDDEAPVPARYEGLRFGKSGEYVGVLPSGRSASEVCDESGVFKSRPVFVDEDGFETRGDWAWCTR